MVQDSEKKLMKIKNTPENRDKCHCRVCPSYPYKCGGEVLYCSKGSSHCDIAPEVCICNTCPVFYEYELKGNYFCDKDTIGESGSNIRKKRSDEDDSNYQKIVDIKDASAIGKSVVGSMGSLKTLPFSLDDLHFLPAQIKKIPLNTEDHVNTELYIGVEAEKPMKISSPIMLSGLSFGAVSKETKLVVAETASNLKIGFNSGEGGVLTKELQKNHKNIIVQYSTGRFGIDEKLMKNAGAIEIRFGQGAYPGKGSYLPAEKMTAEIANIRGLKSGQAAYSPAHHPDILNNKDLKNKVLWLKEIGEGVPVGAKIGCGDVEGDVKLLAQSGVDFIALDGFGGGTGATDKYVRENVGIPIFSALPRAYNTLKDLGLKDRITLIAGGGLRSSADFAKCLALGADALYIGTAALIAINCEQYRICYTGRCPTGITTQDPILTKQVDHEDGVKKLSNFIELSTKEIANFTRIVGKNDVSKLYKDDIVSLDKDLARATGVRWLNGEYF
ncbi:MAG TPA: glutamate synthase-related protein [Methanobacterium sp.]